MSLGKIRLRTIQRIVTLVQYVLSAIIVYVLVQITVSAQYSTALIPITATISSVLACSMLVILAHRFLSWFRTNRDHVILLYGVSAVILAITCATLFIFVDGVIVSTKPDVIMPKVGGTGLYIAPETVNGILDNVYIILSILSFLSIWVATSFLLRQYAKRIGRIRYWILVSTPLVFFTSQFFGLLLDIFGPLLRSAPVFYGILLTFIFTFSKLAGAIFFGIGFWTVAKRLKPEVVVRRYMVISAYGLVLLFISYQVNGVVVTSYPPFGIVTISSMGLACYLILIGIYSSAVSLSQDITLRRTIRKFAVKEPKLLDSIASAEVVQDIEKKVMEISSSMTAESGIEPSLTEEDISAYLETVLKEMKKRS